MAVTIGPRIGLDGEDAYRKQIQNIIEQTKTLDTELKAVTASFSENTSAQEKAKKTSSVLKQEIDAQKEKLKLLNEMLEASKKETGENSTETLKWKQAVNNANTDLSKMEHELKNVNDTADKSKNKFEGFGKALKVAGAAVVSFTVAAGAAAVKLAKDVISSYGELEQNLGGSEAVFGEYADNIQKASEDAYRAMGTSQSEYLATANKIGALLQGSGIEQERSLDLTTQAMQRAADMASVMGIDTASALEAVTGAAKGNYTIPMSLAA